MKSGAFGALIPVGKDVISKIINGKRAPNPHVAERIERLTGGDISSDQWGNNEKI
jgi:DNA-binding transcriptional regulator YdaS (Cro superfamily)